MLSTPMRTNGHRPGPAPPARAPAALADVAGRERQLRRVQALLLTLGGLLVLTIAALAISVVALNRDIDAVARAAPRDDSVGTSALRGGAVTSPKLAAGAVATGRIADGAVTGAKVARDSLTGSQIDESTLTPVARATRAGTADRASDASMLGGVAAAGYVRAVTAVRAQTATSTLAVKGPLSASCPSGTTVVAGGAEVDGAARVAITTSAPDGTGAWVARAAAIDTPSSPWRLVVNAVCATGG
jgi:hypothetical protein